MRGARVRVSRFKAGDPSAGRGGGLVLEIILGIGPMGLLREGDCWGSSTSTALRAGYGYEYGRGAEDAGEHGCEGRVAAPGKVRSTDR